MHVRIDRIIIGILLGALGVWRVLTGMNLIRTNLINQASPSQVMAGLVFFFGGALSFFDGTLATGGQGLTLYPWIQYFMILPILAGLGFILVWEGVKSNELMVILVGILPLLGAAWYAVAKFPGHRVMH